MLIFTATTLFLVLLLCNEVVTVISVLTLTVIWLFKALFAVAAGDKEKPMFLQQENYTGHGAKMNDVRYGNRIRK